MATRQREMEALPCGGGGKLRSRSELRRVDPAMICAGMHMKEVLERARTCGARVCIWLHMKCNAGHMGFKVDVGLNVNFFVFSKPRSEADSGQAKARFDALDGKGHRQNLGLLHEGHQPDLAIWYTSLQHYRSSVLRTHYM